MRKKKLEILMGSAMRLAAPLFPTNVPLSSSHFRVHLFDILETHGNLLASERLTEGLNQANLRDMDKIKRIPGDMKKAVSLHQMHLTRIFASPIPKRKKRKLIKME